jgi:hypothetical protein
MNVTHPNPIGIKEGEKRLRQARAARKRYEADWYLNLAFFQGEQWVAHDSRGLYHPRTRKGQVRLTDNRVQPIVRTEVARLTKTRPGWAATPEDTDDVAVNSAKASTRCLDWGYDHCHFQRHRHEATTWSRICGAGFVKTVLDPTAGGGTDVYVKPDGKAVMHPVTKRAMKVADFPDLEQQLPGVQRKTIGAGEPVLSVRSPFDIFPDPLATSLEDARWIIDETVRSPEYVQEHYGVTLQPDAPAEVGIVESGFHGAAVDAAQGEFAGIRVFELWEPPSKSVPEGRRLVWACGQVLYEGPNEYELIPYAMFPGIMVPGRFWPDAVVTQLRPIQARWNKMLSQIAENLSKFGSPALLIDKLAGIKIHGVPGEHVMHNAAAGQRPPVEYLQPPSVPGYSFNFMQQMETSFREISGQYEVSQGTVPNGVTAASAISLLQEQDATRLGPDVEQLEVALGKVGQQFIKIIGKFFTTDRIMVIVGEGGILDVDTFRADTDTFKVPRISVQPYSTFPRSIAAKQAAIRDYLNLLLQYSVPIEPAALAKVLKDTEVGGIENLVASTVTDLDHAQREHVDLQRGINPVVREVDNHLVHIACHEDYMKSPRCTPEQYQVLLAHNQEHRQGVAKNAQRDQALAVLSQPPPVPPPPGGGPAGPAGAIPTQPSGNPLPMDAPTPPMGAPPA